MENIIIETPLRTIHLKANNSRKDFNTLEEESIGKYEALHQFIYELNESYAGWYKEAVEHRATLQSLIKEVEMLEAEQKRFGSIAGYQYSEMDMEEGTINLKPDVFRQQVAEFAARYDVFFAAFKPFLERFMEMEKDYEEFDPVFEDFDTNYFRAIFKEWQTTELDVCRLDDDYDEMKQKIIVEEMRDKAVDEYNTLPWEYHYLVPRINRIYRGVESIYANIKMWKEATKNGDDEKTMWN